MTTMHAWLGRVLMAGSLVALPLALRTMADEPDSEPAVPAPVDDAPKDAEAAEEQPAADEESTAADEESKKPAGESQPAEKTPFKGQTDLDEAIAAKITAESLQDYAKVIQLCDRALRRGLDPENAKFARQLLSSTRIERAARVTEVILESATPPADWPQFRQMALADLELALADDPKNAEGQLLVARLNFLPGGNPGRALTAVEAAIRLSEDKPIVRSQALVLRGDMTSDKEQRLSDYNEALKLQPENVAALRTRGFFLFTTDRKNEARADLEKAVQLDPDHAPTHEALGLVLLLMKDNKGALEHLNRAVELAPDDASAYANRARVEAVAGENDKALADVDRALKLTPDNLGWIMLRASILQQSGRTDEALADVDKLISQRPELVEAVRIRAHLLAASEKLPQAIAELEQAAVTAPKDPELSADLAMFYMADKKPRKAIVVYDKLLDQGIKLAPVYRGRADANLSIGQQKKAIDDYEAALKQAPNDSAVLNNLAWLLATSPDENLRDGKRAIELAKRACEETNYKAAHILSTLAAAYAENGDFKTARKWSQQALDTGDESVHEQLKKELESYQAEKPWRELQNEESTDDTTAADNGAPVKKPVKDPTGINATKPAKPADPKNAQPRPPIDATDVPPKNDIRDLHDIRDLQVPPQAPKVKPPTDDE